MSEQPSGAGLGIRSNPGHEDVDATDSDLMDMFAEEEQETDEPGSREDLTSYPDTDEPEPQGIPGGLAAVPTPSEDDEPLVTPGTTPEEIDQEAERLAGIYETVPELEQGYRSLQGAFTRVSQDYRTIQSEREADAAALADLESRYEQLVDLIQQREAENDPEFAERLAQAEQIRQAVDARLGPITEAETEREQIAREAAETQQNQQAAAFAVQTFQSRHPEVVPNGPEDRQLAIAFRELRTAGVPLDVRSVEHIEIALEAARNPNLKAELMFSPGAVNVPGGIDVLRNRVGATIAATGGTPQGTRPPAQGVAGRRPSAHVEVGSGGAPVVTAPGKQPDEFDAAMEWYEKEFRKGPLFGSGR